ncbi:MAG: phosphoglycolate phosphatase [Pseudomarimonas sp.]
MACRLLLLDLDGTLVDTAPDLYAVACRMRQRRGLESLPFAAFRPWVSRGGTAMLQQSFPDADASLIATLLPEFLRDYGDHLAQHSRVFAGMEGVLHTVESAGARWGVVTNKPEALARGVLDGLGLAQRCAVLIGGDTLAVRKPDPGPLIEACVRLDESVEHAVYVGDDPRDIEAARAAGMRSVAAAWGYIDADADLARWGADHIAALPQDLLAQSILGGDFTHG